jgi:hypothetical protein
MHELAHLIVDAKVVAQLVDIVICFIESFFQKYFATPLDRHFKALNYFSISDGFDKVKNDFVPHLLLNHFAYSPVGHNDHLMLEE